jgi:hypothetical protein
VKSKRPDAAMSDSQGKPILTHSRWVISGLVSTVRVFGFTCAGHRKKVEANCQSQGRNKVAQFP